MQPIPETFTAPEAAGRDSFRVRILEAAEDGCLALPAVIGWLQEAATKHAESLGVGLDWTRENGLAWVLARLYVRMRRYPATGERVAVATWPRQLELGKAYRDFALWADDGTGPLIGVATTAWAIIDLERRRPRPLGAVAEKRIAVMAPGALEFEGASVPEPEAVERTGTVVPRPSDLDLQSHVNNARLAAWVLDSLYGVAPRPFQPAALDIAYRAECRLGDRVEARLGVDENGRRRIALAREGGGSPFVRAVVIV